MVIAINGHIMKDEVEEFFIDSTKTKTKSLKGVYFGFLLNHLVTFFRAFDFDEKL